MNLGRHFSTIFDGLKHQKFFSYSDTIVSMQLRSLLFFSAILTQIGY